MNLRDIAWIAPVVIILFVWVADRNARSARRRRSRPPVQPLRWPDQAKHTAKRPVTAASNRVSKSTKGERRRTPPKKNAKKEAHEAIRASGASGDEMARSPQTNHSSFTQIDTFERCPKKYWFGYIAREKPSFVSVEAEAGKALHTAINWAYEQRDTRSLPAKATVLQRFKEIWQSDIAGAEVRVVRSNRTVADYEAELRSALGDFYSRTLQADATETIGTEYPIKLDLGGLEYRGFADRVARDSKGIFIVDYKTTRRVGQETAHVTQLRSYGVAVMAHHDASYIGLLNEYLVLRTSHAVRFTAREAATFKRQLQRRAEETVTATSYPAKVSPLCHWCPYQNKYDEFRSSWVARKRF